MHALDLREHRRNDAAFGLSPADAPETEKLFLPAWPESSRLRPLNLSPSQIRTCGFPAYGSS